jgi:hypothetical protein
LTVVEQQREPTLRIFALHTLKWFDTRTGSMTLVGKFADADCPMSIAGMAHAQHLVEHPNSEHARPIASTAKVFNQTKPTAS